MIRLINLIPLGSDQTDQMPYLISRICFESQRSYGVEG